MLHIQQRKNHHPNHPPSLHPLHPIRSKPPRRCAPLFVVLEHSERYNLGLGGWIVGPVDRWIGWDLVGLGSIVGHLSTPVFVSSQKVGWGRVFFGELDFFLGGDWLWKKNENTKLNWTPTLCLGGCKDLLKRKCGGYFGRPGEGGLIVSVQVIHQGFVKWWITSLMIKDEHPKTSQTFQWLPNYNHSSHSWSFPITLHERWRISRRDERI